MFGLPSSKLSDKVRADLKRKLKDNAVYKKHRWNLPERMLVFCSTHYLKAMFILWGVAGSALLIAELFRTKFHSFAHTQLKGVTALPTWMSNLLGSQLTVIGIVFPLVVGLISVLFQKKSSRIHIQSAYQLHSGYMFAGLSGLSLAAFILIGGLVSSIGDKYLDIAIAITALLWMLFNIVLSIWFFITSLNVLDDKKRDRLMLKYFQSEIVEKYLIRSLINSWIEHPGIYIEKHNIKGIEILPWYISGIENMHQITYHLRKEMEIRNVKLRPLYFLLRRLRPVKGKIGKIVFLPSLGRKKNKITLVVSSDVVFPRCWTFLFRRCFIRGPQKNWKKYRHITRDFYGEVYDALEDKNISTFTSSTDRLIETYTTLKKSFRYRNGNFIDECDGSGAMVTFSQSFHRDFYEFSHEAVKSLETTGEYFRKIIDVPFSVYRGSDTLEIGDFQQNIQSLFYVWHALIDWKTGYGENLSISQEQRHRELVKCFTGEWESWYMWRRLKQNAGDGSNSDSDHLLHHLYQTAQIVMTAVMADDRFASDHSTDMLLLWYSQNRFEEHFVGYRWHSFFLTPSYLALAPDEPDWLSVLRGEQYSDKAAQEIIFSNSLADIRLLTAGYILSHIKQKKNVRLKEVIKRLLNSELVYPTGTHDRMTASFTSATDIIDSIIRLEYRQEASDDGWFGILSRLVKALSASNETGLIAGRIYMGTYEDVRNMYGSYADIAFYLSPKSCPVSRRVLDALEDNIFPYHRKEQIIYQLQRMKRSEEATSRGYLMSAKDFKAKIVCFNETLDAYIQAFSQSLRTDLLKAEVDTKRLKNTDLTLTHTLPAMLAQDALLSHFSFSSSEDGDKQWETKSVCETLPKNIIARGINSNVYGELTSLSIVKKYLLNDVYSGLGRLPPAYTEEVRDIDELLKHVRKLTSDNDNYTLIFFGTRLVSELRELTYHEDKHPELGITIDNTSRVRDLMPLRINNCVIYQAWGYKRCYSLLVRNSTFGDLHLLSDSDGVLFSTSWQSSDGDPLAGTVTTLWKQKLEISGSMVARFEHI